jgi:hypothetical protein
MTADADALPPTDASHLRTLSILYYVNAGLSLFALVVIGLQAVMLSWMETLPTQRPAGFEQMWSMFAVVWVVIAVFSLAMGALNVATARALGRRDRRLLCQVTAGINCLSVPLGTLLGVFTLITLERPAVREAFAANDAARRR